MARSGFRRDAGYEWCGSGGSSEWRWGVTGGSPWVLLVLWNAMKEVEVVGGEEIVNYGGIICGECRSGECSGEWVSGVVCGLVSR